jgi:hypothetical protein
MGGYGAEPFCSETCGPTSCLLHLICPGWACAPVLLLHAMGVVWTLAPSPFTTLHHAGGDLRPLLQDVGGRADISAPIQDLPHAALFRKEDIPYRWLLLPAHDQGYNCVHRRAHSHQVRPLEG